jgi:hypothetical protein
MDRAKSRTVAPESGRKTRVDSVARTRAAPAMASYVDQILFFQRTVGNQTVGTLLAGTLHAPPERVQRQGPSLTTVRFKFAPIKEHIRTRFPELHKLIADNPFSGAFTDAYSETIDGKTHTWQISVEFNDLGLAKRGMTGPAPSPTGKPHIHRIRTLINTFAFEDEELKKQFPDPVKREEARHAETLTHELIHASVLMKEQGAVRTEDSGVLVGYRKMLETSKSGAVDKERLAVLSGISLILLHLNLLENDEAARQQFIERQFDVLVEEKYAYGTARSSFERSIDNKTIARIYVEDFVRNQQRKAKQKELSPAANLARVDLFDAVKQFHDKIDSELAASAQPVREEPRQE